MANNTDQSFPVDEQTVLFYCVCSCISQFFTTGGWIGFLFVIPVTIVFMAILLLAFFMIAFFANKKNRSLRVPKVLAGGILSMQIIYLLLMGGDCGDSQGSALGIGYLLRYLGIENMFFCEPFATNVSIITTTIAMVALLSYLVFIFIAFKLMIRSLKTAQ